MKYCYLLLFVLTAGRLAAQEDDGWQEPSKESQVYHEYRYKATVPPYGLAHVKSLITGISNDADENRSMKAKTYQALPLREKFTYHMIHAEAYSQNCDVMPPIQDEHLKIFGRLPDAFDEYSWSDRQTGFLAANRDSVMALIKESVGRSKHVGVNYKTAIVAVKGKELIPFLLSIYKLDRKDHDLLTVLLLLMEQAQYAPFKKTATYTKLYGPESNYQSYLQYNRANEELIIKRAMEFYNSGK
ncbi:hypothetical protein [Taibaiella chishuiensis]|uniref:Uncharacterized protein n=1 Tax=Taibaiella chishuiensis TaxID=1434707 RepID=A0A2P8D5P3_9BACT|nr:hypothetical protein [Taibaiella chishuiensis]PSK92545.1 hypothetical protein B0I18_103122 [Taibaiella chishuiensis]